MEDLTIHCLQEDQLISAEINAIRACPHGAMIRSPGRDGKYSRDRHRDLPSSIFHLSTAGRRKFRFSLLDRTHSGEDVYRDTIDELPDNDTDDEPTVDRMPRTAFQSAGKCVKCNEYRSCV